MQSEAGRTAKARTRSVQLEKGIDIASGSSVKAESIRDLSMPPVPAARSSSLPSGKENSGSIRHYRSMLDIEDAPEQRQQQQQQQQQPGAWKTASHEELHAAGIIKLGQSPPAQHLVLHIKQSRSCATDMILESASSSSRNSEDPSGDPLDGTMDETSQPPALGSARPSRI